jgi:hypothetical protein
MATTSTTSSNYVGKVAGGIIGAAFKEADTLRLGLLTVAENVNYKLNLRKIAYTDGTTDYTCGFTPAGAITLSEKQIVPEKLMNPFQVCKEEYRQTWSEDLLGASASNPNMPSDIMEAIQLEVLSSQAAKVDTDIWTGAAAVDGEFAGFIELFTADAAIIKDGNGVTGPGHSVSESTVEADLKLALAAIPVALRRKDLVVIVSPDVFQAYNFYLISKGIAWNGTTEDKTAMFGRYTITEVNGLPDDTIIVYEKKNLVFATGLQGDHNELAIVDEDEIGLLTGNVRGKIVYNAGVGYYNSAEIVWLLLTT